MDFSKKGNKHCRPYINKGEKNESRKNYRESGNEVF